MTIGAAVTGGSQLPLWIAQADGSYEQEALDVKVVITGSGNMANALVSNQIDLAFVGPGTALALVRNGQETSVILNGVSGGSSYIFGTAEVKTVADCTRWVTTNPGTTGYGYAVAFKKVFNGTWEIVPVGDNATVAATLAGRNANCSTGSGLFGELTDSGKIHVIVDPRKPETLPAGWPHNVIDGSLFGLKANLQQKREAVVRFLRAYHRSVTTTIKSSTSAQLAEMARRSPDNAPINQTALTSAIDILRHSYSPGAPNIGHITKGDWDRTIQLQIDSGATYISPADSKWSYEQRVDMSYWVQANGQPK